MGNAFHKHEYRLQPDELRRLKKATGFNYTQLQRLFRRFHNLDRDGKGYLTKKDLMQVHEIVVNPIGERIAEMFLHNKRTTMKASAHSKSAALLDRAAAHRSDSAAADVAHVEANGGDAPSEDRIYFEDFARTFSTFRPVKSSTPSYAVNSREAKVKFLFNLVDLKQDGEFHVEELHDLLEMMMGADVTDEQLQQISQRIIQEADSNESGAVNYREFRDALKDLDVEGNMSFISFS